ncbi:ferredoxin [Longimycelium tulufanense]|uniref:Ferredoxin n=1 Tax=Longimycelium tulufanense TaxID=907463 RepID=A0A8J3CGE0_9PSEU|nr:ferric reductase-like transmembrane domain-containing protein [Longimycelium tulufanense]GGM71877.1 ferredoxin [Longimycelium tulufanense]
MFSRLTVLAAAITPHDSGVRQMAALSARLAYVMMCLTLCWGVLTATGWVRRTTGRQALRSGHMVLATLTLAFGTLHAAAFTFLDEHFSVVQLIIPFVGPTRHAFGIIGLELMFAVAITVGMRKLMFYRNWLRIHQLAYPAVGLTVIHSWFGAAANGHLSLLWLAGLTLLVPTVTITILRFLPVETLARIGLVEAEPVGPTGPTDDPGGSARTQRINVSVDNQRCRRYGICQAEAPQVFQLTEDGRLHYERRPDPRDSAQARAAARACPTRAIELRENTR